MKQNKLYATFEKFTVYFNMETYKYSVFVNGTDKGSFDLASSAIEYGHKLTD